MTSTETPPLSGHFKVTAARSPNPARTEVYLYLDGEGQTFARGELHLVVAERRCLDLFRVGQRYRVSFTRVDGGVK